LCSLDGLCSKLTCMLLNPAGLLQQQCCCFQTWSEFEQPGGHSFSLVPVEDKAGDGKAKEEVKAVMTPAKDGALAVVDPTKEDENPMPDVRVPPAPPTTKHLLGDAYPDMMSMASTALDFWVKGKTEVRHNAATFVLLTVMCLLIHAAVDRCGMCKLSCAYDLQAAIFLPYTASRCAQTSPAFLCDSWPVPKACA